MNASKSSIQDLSVKGWLSPLGSQGSRPKYRSDLNKEL